MVIAERHEYRGALCERLRLDGQARARHLSNVRAHSLDDAGSQRGVTECRRLHLLAPDGSYLQPEMCGVRCLMEDR